MVVPALLGLSGLGYLQWKAGKDLNALTDGQSHSPFTFWAGLSLGGLLGVWVGTNYGPAIVRGYQACETFLSWVVPFGFSGDDSNRNNADGAPPKK
ncbi:unnamed protein product [Amoebophrya sp. A120]|nr:unnamed protein product [Amoebophrya sp. A120]|eukprot:GSA120T00002419001.1